MCRNNKGKAACTTGGASTNVRCAIIVPNYIPVVVLVGPLGSTGSSVHSTGEMEASTGTGSLVPNVRRCYSVVHCACTLRTCTFRCVLGVG